VPHKIALCTLILLAAVFGAVRHDAWEVIGPGGGGAQFFPAINPLNPADVFVACDMTGAYVSRDGGTSWRMFNLGQVAKGFIFDPSDVRTVYTRTAGERSDGRGGALWRSTDAGNTWPSPAFSKTAITARTISAVPRTRQAKSKLWRSILPIPTFSTR